MQAAYDTIMANAAKNAPGARVQGVLAEQMLPKGFEVLLGVSTDPQFGHVIMAGLGGCWWSCCTRCPCVCCLSPARMPRI